MSSKAIISREESLRILEADLRRTALEKHAAELRDATPEKRAEITKEIERDIRKELRRRRGFFGIGLICD